MNIWKFCLFTCVCIASCSAMASDEILCDPGYYKENDVCTQAPAGTVSPGGNSTTYKLCNYNKYANDDQSECLPCPPQYPYSGYRGKRIEDCFNICVHGTYMASVSATKCTSAGTDEWAPMHVYYYGHDYKTDNTVHKCPGTTQTSGRIGIGANDETDCAHILHIGDSTMRLVSKKQTSPALAVSINSTIYWAQMSETKRPISNSTDQTLNIDFSNTHYYVHDDTIFINDTYPWESDDFDWAELGTFTYDENNDTWSVKFVNSKWTGISQLRNNGTRCFCKMLSPVITDWSEHPYQVGHSCAFTCGWGLAGTPIYKANLVNLQIE